MSLLSDVQIANNALDAIGTRSTISSFLENSKEAKACARQYPTALAAILRAAHWNFARRQVSLTLLQDATATPPGVVPQPWLYEYAYPSDCILARYIMPLLQGNPASAAGAQSLPYYVGQPVRFLVGADKDSGGNYIKVLLTNQKSAVLVYTALITDTGMFDEDFARALSDYLAALVCLALSGDKTLAKMCVERAQQTCNQAQKSNGNEGLTVIDVIPDWIRVRGYASDWAFPPGSFFQIAPQSLNQIT